MNPRYPGTPFIKDFSMIVTFPWLIHKPDVVTQLYSWKIKKVIYHVIVESKDQIPQMYEEIFFEKS